MSGGSDGDGFTIDRQKLRENAALLTKASMSWGAVLNTLTPATMPAGTLSILGDMSQLPMKYNEALAGVLAKIREAQTSLNAAAGNVTKSANDYHGADSDGKSNMDSASAEM